MACSDIAGVSIESLAFVEKNLMLDMSETDAVIQFTELINASLKSAFPRINFFFHTLAQMISGNTAKDDSNMLSFVPQLYTKSDDGRIRDVKVMSFEKRMIPHKVYVSKPYVFKVCFSSTKPWYNVKIRLFRQLFTVHLMNTTNSM